MNVRKAIARKHGEDPGIAAGLERSYAGLVEARKGIKRVQSLVKLTEGADGGEREINLTRDKIDEAEMWLARAVQAVKSGKWPPPEQPVGVPSGSRVVLRADVPTSDPFGGLDPGDLTFFVFDNGLQHHVRVTHSPSGLHGDAAGSLPGTVRQAALDQLIGKLEVVGG